MLAALHDPDLVAIGGLGAAFATLVLAIFAGFQMKASMNQVTTMTHSAQDQIDALKETTADELALVHKQIQASTAQNEAVREAARAQMQPIVFAHGFGSPLSDATGRDAPPGRVRLRYYLKNEGVGPALDVEHGVSIGGVDSTVNDAGARYRTPSAGETAPPGYPNSQAYGVLAVDVLNAEPDRIYWTRFSNVFGDRFEVLNYPEASRPAVFRELGSDG